VRDLLKLREIFMDGNQLEGVDLLS